MTYRRVNEQTNSDCREDVLIGKIYFKNGKTDRHDLFKNTGVPQQNIQIIIQINPLTKVVFILGKYSNPKHKILRQLRDYYICLLASHELFN